MNTDDVTDLVRRRGEYSSEDEARRVTTEVLTVLGSRDLGGEAARLAAQLPSGFAELLTDPGEDAGRFGEDEFIERLRGRLDQTADQARDAAHAVLSSIAEAVSEGERTDFMAALPADLSGYARWS